MPKEVERLLLFGGTFNPVHFGHTEVAAEVARKLAISTIRMIPNGDPPHRPAPAVRAEDRLHMLDLTLEDISSNDLTFESDAIEVERTGTSYTFDTVTTIHQKLPRAYLYLLLGQDAFDQFYRWHRPNDIAKLCSIVVINRPGYDSAAFNNQNRTQLREETQAKVQFVEITPHDISSTRIRTAFHNNDEESVRSWLNPRVFHFIKEQQFYVE